MTHRGAVGHAPASEVDSMYGLAGDVKAMHFLGRVADLHFTPMCAMLLTASEGERHGTHFRAVSPLS